MQRHDQGFSDSDYESPARPVLPRELQEDLVGRRAHEGRAEVAPDLRVLRLAEAVAAPGHDARHAPVVHAALLVLHVAQAPGRHGPAGARRRGGGYGDAKTTGVR